MPLQSLENTVRILQSEIALRMAEPVALVEPAIRVVSALLFVPTGEIAVAVVFRVAKLSRRMQEAFV